MREMDRRFKDMNQQFQRISPQSSAYNLVPRQRSFEEGFPDSMVQSPVVADKEGKRYVSYKFDVHQFRPEEITVKTFDDSRVEVTAKHESTRDNHHVFREYRRTCTLPEGVKVMSLRSTLQPDGVLSLDAPLPAEEPPKTKELVPRNAPVPIKISHQGTFERKK